MAHGSRYRGVMRLTAKAAGVFRVSDLALDQIDPDGLKYVAILQEVVDAARSLTGARISGLTTLDEAGELMSFITSGMTAEERQWFVDMPGGPDSPLT